MEKKQIRSLLLLTIVAGTALILLLALTVYSVNERVRQTSFDRLATSSRQLAVEFSNNIEMDSVLLEAIAAMIADEPVPDDKRVCALLSGYVPKSSYISYVELLRPDGTMLDADGAVRDVSDAFDFEREAGRGPYISDIERSTLDAGERVVRNAVPVIKDGGAIGVLYGVIRLSELSDKYKTNIYGGHAYVLIVDGNTGDFIMDTWHKTAGNISDLGHRRAIPGYSMEKFEEGMKNGVGGNVGFVSKTTGGVLYIHNEPMDVNRWNVLVAVEEKYAEQASASVSAQIYLMAGGIGLIVLLYTAYVLWSITRAYKRVRVQASEDPVTRLLNRRAYDRYIQNNRETFFSALNCVYIKVGGLHADGGESGSADKTMREIADALSRTFAGGDIYHIGEGEFVVLLPGDSGADCAERMRELSAELEGLSCEISYGIAGRAMETGPEHVIEEAEERMLESKYSHYARRDRERDI